MLNSEKFYNEITSGYQVKLNERGYYLAEIENQVIDYQKILSAKSWLDIGCGEGYRTLKLLGHFKDLRKITAIDNSQEMLNVFKKRMMVVNEEKRIQILKKDFTMTSEVLGKYDLITTLWNVFGHLESDNDKEMWLRNVTSNLSETGLFLMDINNKYNLEYGVSNVLRNIYLDLFSTADNRFTLKIGKASTNVHLHNPFELDKLIENSGLEILDKKFFSYRTGKKSIVKFFYGQLLYVCRKKF